MDSELMDRSLENTNKYKLAGYLAFATSVLLIPVTVITIMHDIPATYNPALLPFLIVFTVIMLCCGIYAFYRFKNFLNEYYDFHDIDKLVLPIILLRIVVTLFSLLSKVVPDLKLIAGIMTIVTAIATSIVGIIFCIILLRLKVSLHGLLKPYAYLTIALYICVMTLLLGIVGVILGVVTNVMLGIIFLKTPEEIEVEFV